MPKTTAGRSRGPEVDVARRVALERQRRGMSAAALAQAMVAKGCPINPSAIHKIEQNDPPRRITVDELVAFAQVFELEVEDLLTPPHASLDRHVSRLYADLQRSDLAMKAMAESAQQTTTQLAALLKMNPEVVRPVDVALGQYEEALDALTGALSDISRTLREQLRQGSLLVIKVKPPTKNLKFREPRAFEQRAAEAAAAIPPTPTRQRRRPTNRD